MIFQTQIDSWNKINNQNRHKNVIVLNWQISKLYIMLSQGEEVIYSAESLLA